MKHLLDRLQLIQEMFGDGRGVGATLLLGGLIGALEELSRAGYGIEELKHLEDWSKKEYQDLKEE